MPRYWYLHENLKTVSNQIYSKTRLILKIDIGTRLEAKRTIDAFLAHRGMRNLTNTCSNMAGSDVFNVFKCMHPWDPQLLPQLLEGITPDVQVIAYISMRKCVNFNTQWRRVVEQFLENS